MLVTVGIRFYDELWAREVDTYLADAYGLGSLRQSQYDSLVSSMRSVVKRTKTRITLDLQPEGITFLQYLVKDYNANAGWEGSDDSYVDYFMRTYPTWVSKLPKGA